MQLIVKEMEFMGKTIEFFWMETVNLFGKRVHLTGLVKKQDTVSNVKRLISSMFWQIFASALFGYKSLKENVSR